MQPLYEQYRPKTWDDVVGQDGAVHQIRTYAKRGLAGRAFWIAGLSGTGKTTIARLIAAEVADEWFVEEMDATELTAARLREIAATMQYTAMGKGGRAFIINEAHGLRRDIIRPLLGLIEPPPPHVVVIFTTTVEGQDRLFEDQIDAGPLLSRCHQIELERRPALLIEAFAQRAQQIAQAAGLDGHAISGYRMTLKSCNCNLRKLLQGLER